MVKGAFIDVAAYGRGQAVCRPPRPQLFPQPRGGDRDRRGREHMETQFTAQGRRGLDRETVTHQDREFDELRKGEDILPAVEPSQLVGAKQPGADAFSALHTMGR